MPSAGSLDAWRTQGGLWIYSFSPTSMHEGYPGCQRYSTSGSISGAGLTPNATGANPCFS
jgi:hypothetical protein